MNLLELFEKLKLTDEEVCNWMVSQGLIHGSMMCNNCQRAMQDRMDGRNRYWICENRACRTGPTNQTKPKKGFLIVCSALMQFARPIKDVRVLTNPIKLYSHKSNISSFHPYDLALLFDNYYTS
uniref:Transposase n=1 Tax=Acrobeloides nanus TaxID=290746 RepID=A0A914EJB7_9BILA